MQNNGFIVIPKIVDDNEDLTVQEKYLLGKIVSLSMKRGYCFASNRYFARYLKIKHIQNVSPVIVELQRKGFIEIKRANSSERKIYLGEVLWKFIRGFMKKQKDPLENQSCPSGKAEETPLENQRVYNKEDNKQDIKIASTSAGYAQLPEGIKIIVEEYYFRIAKIATSGRMTGKGASKLIQDALKQFEPYELILAMIGFANNSWQMDNNGKRGINWFFRDLVRLAQYCEMYNAEWDDEEVANIKKKFK